MSRTPIPERQPIGDSFTGAAIQVGAAQALTVEVPDAGSSILSGTMTVRYGVRYLGKAFLSIIPGLIAVDYGTILTGEEAWDFLLKRSNLYPRAEVFGYRSDGRDDMMTVKNLDLAQPVDVLVYAEANATVPIAKPTALIADERQTATLPQRLVEALERFPSVAAWQTATEDVT
jgi:hypothetical protein